MGRFFKGIFGFLITGIGVIIGMIFVLAVLTAIGYWLAHFVEVNLKDWFLAVGLIVVGWWIYYVWGKRRYQQGFVDGWIRRHRGEGVTPQDVKDITIASSVTFSSISLKEKELLKDPEERQRRGLPPIPREKSSVGEADV